MKTLRKKPVFIISNNPVLSTKRSTETIKYSNMMNYLGLIIIIISAIMKVFQLGLGQINVNLLLMTGFILAYIGQSWKVSLLEKEIRNRKV